jgi:hypothetical protein
MEQAISEIKGLVSEHFPEVTFRIFQGFEPVGIRLEATGDIDDPDEVRDVFRDRYVGMKVEERLSLYVIVVRPIERTIAQLEEQERAKAIASQP